MIQSHTPASVSSETKMLQNAYSGDINIFKKFCQLKPRKRGYYNEWQKTVHATSLATISETNLRIAYLHIYRKPVLMFYSIFRIVGFVHNQLWASESSRFSEILSCLMVRERVILKWLGIFQSSDSTPSDCRLP